MARRKYIMNKYYKIKLNNNIRCKPGWDDPSDTSVLIDIIEKKGYIKKRSCWYI